MSVDKRLTDMLADLQWALVDTKDLRRILYMTHDDAKCDLALAIEGRLLNCIAKLSRMTKENTMIDGPAPGAPVKPTIGRIVHYTNLGDKDGKYPPEIQAAIITKVNADGTCALKIFYPTGIFDMPSVNQSEAAPGTDKARGHWAWPARE